MTAILDETAIRISIKLIKQQEGCELRAYPDPASELPKEMVKHGLLIPFLQGKVEIPTDMMEKFDGKPWTIGYGETEGVKPGDVWTQLQADTALESEVRRVMSNVLKACPQLVLEPPSRIAACTSLTYNIGIGNFSKSTVCAKTNEKDYHEAGEAFLLFNKAHGQVLVDLVKRRQIEKDLYMAVST